MLGGMKFGACVYVVVARYVLIWFGKIIKKTTTLENPTAKILGQKNNVDL